MRNWVNMLETEVSRRLPIALPLQAKGRSLLRGGEKLSVRGVTYGPFGPAGSDSEYHNARRVERDFADMVSANVNAFRTYTVPPGWFLDLAEHDDFRLIVTLTCQPPVTFL